MKPDHAKKGATVFAAMLCTAGIAHADSPAAAIVRVPLLTAVLPNSPSIAHVEIKKITLASGQRTGLHSHPCPVLSYVVSGTIIFQIDGQPEQRITAGSAIYEPADTIIKRFDAVDGPATFVADYLLRSDQHELIRPLE